MSKRPEKTVEIKAKEYLYEKQQQQQNVTHHKSDLFTVLFIYTYTQFLFEAFEMDHCTFEA